MVPNRGRYNRLDEFLLYYWQEYSTWPDIQPFIKALLGEPPFAVHTFNAYWQIERFDEVEDVSNTVPQQIKHTSSIFKSDDPILQRWIDAFHAKNLSAQVSDDDR